SIEKLMHMAYACTAGIYPAGRKVGLVTVSGGVGVLMADDATRFGLEIPPMPEETQRKMKEMLPYAAVRNPIDVTGQALADLSLVQKNLELMLAEGGCDAVVLFLASLGLSPRLSENLATSLLALRGKYSDSLVVLSIMVRPEMRKRLEEGGFLAFEDPGTAIEAVSVLNRFYAAFNRPPHPPPPPLPAGAQPPPEGAVGEQQAMALLASAGLPVVRQRLATSEQEAEAAGDALGWPVVLKIASPDIAHKTEMGGVLLNIQGAAAAAEGFRQLQRRAAEHHPRARVDGVLVAPMISGGVETILGVQHDPVFGPVVMFGLGGIMVEVMKDVALRLAPFSEAEAQQMIREVKGFPLLEGARGRPRADIDALARALAQLSVYAAAHAGRLESLDVNPFLVLPEGKGALALDALIVPRGPVP
ncbi:MAG: acetate--CoA ligase family protein, partial [bacterium]